MILGNTPNTRLSADAGKLIVSGVIDDGVNTLPLIVRNNTGTTVLTAANTYGGETLVYNGVLQIDGGDDRVPGGSVLRLGINSFVSGTFDLNGRNQTVAGLAVNGNDNLNSQGCWSTVRSPAASPCRATRRWAARVRRVRSRFRAAGTWRPGPARRPSRCPA